MNTLQFAGRLMVGPGSGGGTGVPVKYEDASSAIRWIEGPDKNTKRRWVRVWLRNGLGVALAQIGEADAYALGAIRATGPYVEGSGTPWRFDNDIPVPSPVRTPEDVWEAMLGLVTLTNPFPV